MRRTEALLTTAILAASANTASGAPPVFEVRTELTSPSGESLGRPQITTEVGSEATLEFRRAGQRIKLTFLVKEAINGKCHPLHVRIERVIDKQPKKETSLVVTACDGKTVDFDGRILGAPSMKISLERIGR